MSLTLGDAISKGKKLQELMKLDNYSAGVWMPNPRTTSLPWAESPFLDQAQVKKWGYTASCWKKPEPDFLDKIYKHLRLKTDQEAFVVIYNQNNKFFLNGAEQGSTDAKFTNIVNHTNGFLVAFENHGPNYIVGNSRKAVPDLKHWSNIAYLQWTDPIAATAPGSGELKYVLRNAIENGDTISIINKILNQYRQTAKKN